eukprot:gb/GECG01014753.1/.p1 GENE.gb/GECG01014753.1/~~gb/GECG01014753.1/.p1  ORF type:complete len:362 (+),score=33.86 gb/GECG01014753.1/:1-1086(+)
MRIGMAWWRTWTHTGSCMRLMGRQACFYSNTTTLNGTQKALNVALVGAPNAGKSMLLNRFLGDKVTAVSRKRNTTRRGLSGVYTSGSVQLVFFDTPGFVDKLEKKERSHEMVVASQESITDADVVLIVVDMAKKITEKDTYMIHEIVNLAASNEAQPLLCLNKTDLVRRDQRRKPGKYSSKHDAFVDIFEAACYKHELLPSEGLDATPFPWTHLTSALQNEGIEKLRNTLLNLAVPREWLFEEGMSTEMTNLERVEEVVREKIMNNLHQEVPYNVYQANREWRLNHHGELVIHQDLVVGRKAYLNMLVGRGSKTLRVIRESAIRDLERLFGCKVHLFLHATVKPQMVQRMATSGSYGSSVL